MIKIFILISFLASTANALTYKQVLDEDTGVKGDNVSSNGGITSSGTCTLGAVVTVNDTHSAPAKAEVTGTTWTYHQTLAVGYHTLYATEVKPNGKSGFSNVGPQTQIVENKPPVVSNVVQTYNAKSKMISIKGHYEPYLVNSMGLPSTTIEIFNGATRVGKATLYSSPQGDFLAAPTLPSGTYDLTLRATGPAGAVAESKLPTIVVP